jgi:hypothetical protein
MFARLKEKIQSAGSTSESKAESDSERTAPPSSNGSPKVVTPVIATLSQDDSRGLGLEAMSRFELETFAAKRHRQWQRSQEKLTDLVCLAWVCDKMAYGLLAGDCLQGTTAYQR